MKLDLLGVGGIIEGVGQIADDLVTSKEEKMRLQLDAAKIEAELVQGQISVNQTEAEHGSVFVAGWRPFIGWIGGLALAYQFLAYPLMTWSWAFFQARGWVAPEFEPPPVLDAQELWVILTGMLGIAGMRSFDKLRGTDTKVVTRGAK